VLEVVERCILDRIDRLARLKKREEAVEAVGWMLQQLRGDVWEDLVEGCARYAEAVLGLPLGYFSRSREEEVEG